MLGKVDEIVYTDNNTGNVILLIPSFFSHTSQSSTDTSASPFMCGGRRKQYIYIHIYKLVVVGILVVFLVHDELSNGECFEWENVL